MKTMRLFIIVMGLFLLHGPCLPLLAQRIISDAPLEVREGKLLSDRVIVRFHHQVIDFTEDKTIEIDFENCPPT